MRHIRRATILAAFAASMSLAGCQSSPSNRAADASPSSRESHHPTRAARHAYDYYPHAQVYHDRVTEMYFWIDDFGNWRFGTRLPEEIQLDASGPVIVEASSEGPYGEHELIAARYGRMPYGHGPSSSQSWDAKRAVSVPDRP